MPRPIAAATGSPGSKFRPATIHWPPPINLGRPVAILRMGGRVPNAGPDPNFYYGSPPWVAYPPRTTLEAKPVREAPPPPAAAQPAVVVPKQIPQP